LRHLCLNRRVVGGVAQGHLHLELRQELGEEPVRAAVGILTETTRSPGLSRLNSVLLMMPMPSRRW